MNTLAFTFGIVCTLAVITVAVLVWIVVKVLKQEKAINKQEDDLLSFVDQVWKQRDEERRNQSDELHHLDRRFDHVYQDMDMRHRDINTAVNDQITDAVTQCKSYTDSRIDKILDVNKPKQVIKG